MEENLEKLLKEENRLESVVARGEQDAKLKEKQVTDAHPASFHRSWLTQSLTGQRVG